jgi:hypothetical protein
MSFSGGKGLEKGWLRLAELNRFTWMKDKGRIPQPPEPEYHPVTP